MSPPSRLFSLHYGVTVTGIETSRVKTLKENKLEFRTFAETSSETRIVFVRIAINEEKDSNKHRTTVERRSI